MLGVNTISSIAFPKGSICLNTRVCVSGCALSERVQGETRAVTWTHLAGSIRLQRKEQNLAVETTNIDLRAYKDISLTRG